MFFYSFIDITTGMGRKVKSCNSNEEFSAQKDHIIPKPPVTTLCPVIKKVDIKKYSIQKKKSFENNPACKMSQDNTEITYDANQNVPCLYLSLDTSHENVNITDSDSEEIPIKVSSAQEREARRLARLKQLEKMRAFEAAFSRQSRYQKRTNSMRLVKGSIKKVKWKREDLFVYHFYHNESEPDQLKS